MNAWIKKQMQFLEGLELMQLTKNNLQKLAARTLYNFSGNETQKMQKGHEGNEFLRTAE